MRRRTKITVTIFTLLLIAATALFLWHINGPRVVARAAAPDGTEFYVIQTSNWDFEFFTTACYYRRPGGRWGWFYYDHQDWYWGRGHAEIDERSKRISIIRDGRITVTFDWELERVRLLRSAFPHRTFIGAQEWMPEGWSIAQK